MADLNQILTVGDLDELLREVERRCDAHDWEGVEEIRVRSRAAIERGHQLWPAASWAEYRIALDAPAESAASVITDASGYMAPGPLTEVIAQNHTWAELAGHLPVNAKRPLVAQERTIRGERVPEGEAGDLPGTLADWEPSALLPTYTDHGLTNPDPPQFGLGSPDLVIAGSGPYPAVAFEGVQGVDALRSGVGHWATRSNGTVLAAGFSADTSEALRGLAPTAGGSATLNWWRVDLPEWAQTYSWACATGGSSGPRRGAGSARFDLWWTLTTLLGLEDEWPLDPGPECRELVFGVWGTDAPSGGWTCRLTVEDPLDGLTWVLDATDRDPSTGQM
jgi:hypothetical protein